MTQFQLSLIVEKQVLKEHVPKQHFYTVYAKGSFKMRTANLKKHWKV